MSSLGTFVWKAQRRIFGRYLGKLFYRERCDENGIVPPPPGLMGELNQLLTEAGLTAPWVMTRSECHDFWSSVTNESKFTGNRPVAYAAKSQGIIRLLHRMWQPEVSHSDSVLEIGCNCGANLNGLRALGHTRLYGVEINPNAIATMKAQFPELAASAAIHCGSAEDVLPKLPDKSVDAVFTMAVLIHVHPSSRSIFPEMIRIARKTIAVIELEDANCEYVFARNYKRLFERLGCRHLRSELITKEACPEVSDDYYGYIVRIFSVPDHI